MSKRPFMQMYVSDYLGDTMHLTTEQHGAYLLLLMTMWNADGKLPDDDRKLATITRMSMKKWKVNRVDMAAFFIVENGQWENERMNEELQKVESKSQLRASAGAKGGRAKALKYKEVGLANDIAKSCHLPEPELEEKDKSFSKARASAQKKGFRSNMKEALTDA